MRRIAAEFEGVPSDELRALTRVLNAVIDRTEALTESHLADARAREDRRR
jgi:hypothetical protein